MGMFAALLVGTARALIVVLELCMLVRAVLSWFPIRENNPILLFVIAVTEPIVAPIRALFDKMGWFRSLPIDISFLVAYLLLTLVGTLLGVLL
jgi:YggT family protein